MLEDGCEEVTRAEQRVLATEIGVLSGLMARTFRSYVPAGPGANKTLRELADMRGRFVRLTIPTLTDRKRAKRT